MIKNASVLLLAVALLTACSSTKISVNKDKAVDFNQFKSYSFYGWAGSIDDVYPIDKEKIETAFAKEFKARDLKYTELDGDLVVSLFIVVDKGSTQNRYGSYYGSSPYGFEQPTWGWGVGYYYPMGYGPNYAGEPYKENMYYTGTLVCDVFNRSTKKLVWQGVVSKAFNERNASSTDVSAIIHKVMKNYPVKAK